LPSQNNLRIVEPKARSSPPREGRLANSRSQGPMLRLLIAAGAVAAIAVCTTGCKDQCNVAYGPCAPSCPSSFTAGESCLFESQQCVFSTGACREVEAKRTVCTCKNEPGGFRWDCAIKFCSCTCPCGVLATASCDALDCSDAEDPCPENALPFCDQHCGEAGVPDGRADARSDGAARDHGADGVEPDAQRDAAHDALKPDVRRDAAHDAPKPTADVRAKDSAADAPDDGAAAN
jgi:hypothetical protein